MTACPACGQYMGKDIEGHRHHASVFHGVDLARMEARLGKLSIDIEAFKAGLKRYLEHERKTSKRHNDHRKFNDWRDKRFRRK